jgi:outer membrane protein assembly factor BamD (BamD/ComL family)
MTTSSFAEFRIRLWCVGVAAVCLLALGAAAQSPQIEENARLRLNSGRLFLNSQNYSEALKDFEAILQSYPNSAVADDALLEIATYQFNVARDPKDFAVAEGRVKELLNKYPAADATAMALVLDGRITLAKGHGPELVNAAMASFERVPRLFEGSDAVPVSMFFAGEAARVGGRRADALDRFGLLATTFPLSRWTAQALLGSALSLAAAGQPARAMEQLQLVRNKFPSAAEATSALNLNTILYRLYVRAPAQPAFQLTERTIAGPAGRLRDATALAVDAEGNVVVAMKNSVSVFGPKGAQVRTASALEPLSLFFDRFGRLKTVHEAGVRDEAGRPVPLDAPLADGRPRQWKLDAAVMTASGEYLLSDRSTKSIVRFTADRQFVGDFASRIDARRLVVSELDVVAALDADTKSVALYGREGKTVGRIAERTTAYRLREPVDIAFDRANLLTTFALPERVEAAALALDAAGRAYVLDGRSDTVQIYR